MDADVGPKAAALLLISGEKGYDAAEETGTTCEIGNPGTHDRTDGTVGTGGYQSDCRGMVALQAKESSSDYLSDDSGGNTVCEPGLKVQRERCTQGARACSSIVRSLGPRKSRVTTTRINLLSF